MSVYDTVWDDDFLVLLDFDETHVWNDGGMRAAGCVCVGGCSRCDRVVIRSPIDVGFN